MRPVCSSCSRPQGYCYCHTIPSLVSQTTVIILQHPSETKHPLNTAKIAQLGIKNSQLYVGEQFDPMLELNHQRQAVLLFPGESSVCIDEIELIPEETSLVVLDGTWRKAQKILHLNPWLQTLVRISLPTHLRSNYRLRQAKHAGALSTIEAITYTLNTIEKTERYHQLLTPFEHMIDQQIASMGQEVFKRNYCEKP